MIRDIWVRYIHDHPVENNDWGDFQTHRRLLGLVTIGKFETQIELNELCRQHESLKVRYGGTLYESRAIFFGPPILEEPAIASSSTTVTNHNDLETIKENPCPEIKISLPKRLQDEYTTPSNFKAQAFFYRENDLYEDLETHIVDFVNGLFWILESRRLERSREKPEKCSLLTAPFEKREVVGLDRDSRNSKKRITGRTLKNLADLSLQAGLIEDALSLYHNACETLKSIIDFLWEGAAEEGLCAASALLLYPHLRTEETLHRNASLQVGSPLKNTPEKWRSSDLTKRVTTSDKHNHEHSDILSPPPHSASTSSVSSILTNSTLSQTSSSSSSTSTSTISAAHPRGQYSELPGNILKAEEIPIYFHKAIINYSKYGYAAVVEIEASFKAARISIEQNRPLDVAMVLQNVLYINHSLTEKELIRMFEMMTALYQQVGYMRKAAFFQRLAALKHVHQSANQSDFMHTYRLMLSSFPGYMLSLDPMEVLESNSGWPSIQIDFLQSLITAARNLGQSTLATRHMTFLLQTQWHNMKPKEQSEMAVQLKVRFLFEKTALYPIKKNCLPSFM